MAALYTISLVMAIVAADFVGARIEMQRDMANVSIYAAFGALAVWLSVVLPLVLLAVRKKGPQVEPATIQEHPENRRLRDTG
jgi:hypothetical protein